MLQKLKKLVGLPLIILIFVIVILVGISSGELGSAYHVLLTLKPGCILGCCLCFLLYLLIDAVGIHSALRGLGYRVPFLKTLMVTVRGQYYYYITPSSSGGQPMQIYYLHEMGVPTGVGTSVLVCHFAAFQSMLAVLMTLFAIPYFKYINDSIAPHQILLVVGYLINAGIVFMLLLFSFCRRAVRVLIAFVVGFIRKFHLSRHPEAIEKKITETADLFHDSMEQMRSHPWQIVNQLILGGLQQLSLMSVLYVIYKGLGQSGATLPHLIAMGLAQYISAAYVPIPGASGAQEGVFSLFFRQIFPEGECFAAMIIWRTTTFYLPLIISALSIVLYSFHPGRKDKVAEHIGEK